jgi:hypothetical protein
MLVRVVILSGAKNPRISLEAPHITQSMTMLKSLRTHHKNFYFGG